MSVVVAGALLALVVASAPGQVSDPQPTFTSTTPEHERRDRSVTPEDLEILARAQELLPGPSSWNRDDDRDCEDDELAGRRSLFCALRRACTEILGSYDHRRVALQEVRFAIVDATDGREFAHRLRDFNNLPETEFDDIERVLAVARERVSVRLANAED